MNQSTYEEAFQKPAPGGYAEARQLYRVVRAMHDGVCPNCHKLHPADSMLKHQTEVSQTPAGHTVGATRMVAWVCPSCKFTVSREDGEAAIQEFGQYIKGNIETWEKWRQRRHEQPVADYSAVELALATGPYTTANDAALEAAFAADLLPKPLHRYQHDVETRFNYAHRIEVTALMKKVKLGDTDQYVGHACVYIGNHQITWGNMHTGTYTEVRRQIEADAALTSRTIEACLVSLLEKFIKNIDRNNIEILPDPTKAQATLAEFSNAKLGEPHTVANDAALEAAFDSELLKPITKIHPEKIVEAAAMAFPGGLFQQYTQARAVVSAQRIALAARQTPSNTKEQVEQKIAQYLASPQFIGHVQTREHASQDISVIGVMRHIDHMLQAHWHLQGWAVDDVTGNLQSGFVVTVRPSE